MNRYQKEKPQLIKPKKKIELNDKQKLTRFIIMILLIIIGLIFIGIGMNNCIKQNSGWKKINDTTGYLNDISLYYNLDKENPTSINKELTIKYNNYLANSWIRYNSWISDTDEVFYNMYYINNHPNEIITIDKYLYNSLKQVLLSNNYQIIYFAPVYTMFENLLSARFDYQACSQDPYLNNNQKEIYDNFMKYINNDKHIKLELLDNFQVILHLSDEYYSFCNEFFEQNIFIDFCYLKNAFIVDEVADKLINDGFNNGLLYSEDGYKRIFTKDYIVNEPLYDIDKDNISIINKIGFNNQLSIVNFKNFHTSDFDKKYSYIYEDGTRRTNIIKIIDNNYLNTSSINYFTCYSYENSCSYQALKMIDIYINESLDLSMLNDLKKDNINYLYINNYEIHYSDELIFFNDLNNNKLYKTIYDK